MRPSPQRLLVLSAGLTALGAAFALAAHDGRWPPAALWHLVFAVGALPMILAAMGYFVPVLTRGQTAPAALAAAPLTALVAGLGIVGFFVLGEPWLRLAAPWLALAAVASFAAWLRRRWQRCLGQPNPCLAWYAAALALLALGLAAVAAAPLWPEYTRSLRLFHLHLNTLGFMSITALGTLQVLLPTVAGQPDPAVMARLRDDLKWSVGGALALSAGAGLGWWPLALAGTLAYAWPLGKLLRHVGRSLLPQVRAAGNTLALLAAALVGLGFALVHGVAHALGTSAGADALPLFIIAFLLPLVSGAAGHLLPVWLRPGVQSAWHTESRQRLALGARPRAALLLVGGLLAAAGLDAGYMLGAAGGLWLVLALLTVTLSRR